MQLVEIGDHRLCRAFEIFFVAGRPVRLRLDRRDHIHVIDPITRLGGDAVRGRFLPLLVGKTLPEIQKPSVLCLHVDLERDDPDHAVIDMGRRADKFCARSQKSFELFDQSCRKFFVI